MENNRRFFILTIGRTGSSLLASILSDAGGHFGDLDQADWDRSGGAFEHTKLAPIVREFRKMDEIGERRPYQLLQRLKWDLARHRAKKGIRNVLAEVAYVKGELEHAVHWAARMGFMPTVIVSYRRFGPLYESMGHMHPQLPNVHAAQYVRSIQNGLGLLKIYGGCAVDYDEILDADENGWAHAVANSTGLSAEKLIAAQKNRIDANPDTNTESIEPFPECVQAYDMIRKYRGVHIPMARATRRAFGI